MGSDGGYIQIAPEVLEQARQMGLLTYLQHYEPGSLKRIAGNVYCTRENDSLRRIIRDVNDEQLSKKGENAVLLLRFSCHSFRHTFTTRMIEEGVNIKVVQDVLGHKDVETTFEYLC